jgi:hypothetical protein
MGAFPYWYFVPFTDPAERALEALREREWKAGRYYPVVSHLKFDPLTAPRKPRHASIDEARADAAATGTRSILDVSGVGPPGRYGIAHPVDPAVLVDLFETDRPDHATVQAKKGDLFDTLDRGECCYVVVYEDDEPRELFFAGYSYD